MLLQVVNSWRMDKKYAAIFDDHNTIHFGAKNMSDYTIHKDDERKNRYIARHEKNEDWTNPYKPGTLSRYILWEFKSLPDAVKQYNKRFFDNKKGAGVIPADEKLYNDVKFKASLIYDRPSAYKSGYITREYKKQFIKKHGYENAPYISSEGDLERWFAEDWRNQRGEIGYDKPGDIYRPTIRVSKDTPLTYAELTKQDIKNAMKQKKETGRVNQFGGELDQRKTSDIHSVAFDRDFWTEARANRWLSKHNLYPIKRADYWQKNWIRYRIVDPSLFKSFITKKLKDDHINLIIGFY